MSERFDAVIVGAGVNGLAAALVLARAGLSVCVLEQQATIGGAVRSAALTRPDFVHDVGAAVHALGLVSPFLRDLPLTELGVRFAHAPIPFAHPLDGGDAVAVRRDVLATSELLGARDGASYRRLLEPLVRCSESIFDALLSAPQPAHLPTLVRFGARAWRSAYAFARSHFYGERARALWAGAAAHAMVPLEFAATNGYALGLTLSAHAVGWPLITGGSGSLTSALRSLVESHGGIVRTEHAVRSVRDLPPARAVLFDLAPRHVAAMLKSELPRALYRRLLRYRQGPGVFKMDWALHEPVPWTNALVRESGTVHVGGTLSEVAAAEAKVWNGVHADAPYVLVVQPSLADSTRAPVGGHTLWAYCHVPNGSTVDMSERIAAQIERFAPGFRDCILQTVVTNSKNLELGNANLVGGDIAGGAGDLAQLLARPTYGFEPYRLQPGNYYLCSASTPPGIGVHGMCGARAAECALRRTFNLTSGS